MGCWNETCLLSRLPITCGQEIACVFIAPVDAWPGTVYADGQYAPLSLPFFGRYDDYGRIECADYDEAALRSLSNTALWRRNDTDDGWEPVRPPMPGDGRLDERLTDLSDMARQGRLWTNSRVYANGRGPVRLAFFHRDLWDYAVSQRERQMTQDYLDTLEYKWPAAKCIGRKDKGAREKLKSLAAMDAVMNLARVAWQPTCGTGSQACIDYPWQVRLYRKFADRADAFYKSGLD